METANAKLSEVKSLPQRVRELAEQFVTIHKDPMGLWMVSAGQYVYFSNERQSLALEEREVLIGEVERALTTAMLEALQRAEQRVSEHLNCEENGSNCATHIMSDLQDFRESIASDLKAETQKEGMK